jgi:hypothetical protein
MGSRWQTHYEHGNNLPASRVIHRIMRHFLEGQAIVFDHRLRFNNKFDRNTESGGTEC